MKGLLDRVISEELNVSSYLTCRLGKEIFAIEVIKVVEIQEITNITKIPNAPAYMAGVMNLRGKVLPLVDARIKFGLPPTLRDISTCIIVIEVEIERELTLVGMLVDAVMEVIKVSEKNLTAISSLEAKFPLEYVQNMIKHNDKFILCLNLNKVFALEKETELRDKKSKKK